MRCYSSNHNAAVGAYRAASVPDVRERSSAPLPSTVAGGRTVEKYFQTAAATGSPLRPATGPGMFPGMQALFTSLFETFASLLGSRPIRETAPVPTQSESGRQVMPTLQPVAPKAGLAGSMPGLSMKRNGAKPDDIWRGFRQGPSGNCVTVSAIKAAMHRFGQSPTDIYKAVTKTADCFRVVMRDDFVLSLTERELRQAAWGSNFVGRDGELLKDAHFLYAASVKRAQMENNDGTAGRSFHAAMRSLNDKEDEFGPGEGLERLGLRKHMRTVKARKLGDGLVGICNRRGHSVAVIDGLEEMWGRKGRAPVHGDAIALV